MVSGIRFRDGTVIDFQGTNVTIEVDEQNDTVTIANGQESFVFEANGDFSVPGGFEFEVVRANQAAIHGKTLESGDSFTINQDEGVVVSQNYTVNGTLTIEDGGSITVV